jgi:RHS repeat-associated protein
MEKDDEHTQGKYDFGARIYDSRLGRWMGVDAYHGKYAFQSPYNYVGNCPITFVDYEGNDHGIYVDHTSRTITIKANFYTSSKNAKKQMLKAFKILNAQDVSFVSDNLGDRKDNGYSIVFDLTVELVENNQAAIDKATADAEGNFVEINEEKLDEWDATGAVVPYPDMDNVVEGTEPNYEGIYLKEKYDNKADKKRTALHEMLHLFGASHEAKSNGESVIKGAGEGVSFSARVFGAILEKSSSINSTNSKISTQYANKSQYDIIKHHGDDKDRNVTINNSTALTGDEGQDFQNPDINLNGKVVYDAPQSERNLKSQ